MKTRGCSSAVRTGRLAKANGFLLAGDDVETLDDDGDLRDAVVTLFVHAGIAAADAICCARLGKHAQGEDHAEAVGLLKTAESGSAKHLQTLLRLKTKAGYSHQKASKDDLKRASRAAHHLVELARSIAT